MNFFISDAVAASAASGPQSGSPMMSIIMLAGFVLIFYFLLWRPQSKRAKEHRELISGLEKGDEIVTAGGIIGKVSKLVSDDVLAVVIAEGVEIRLKKVSVSSVLPKGTLKSS